MTLALLLAITLAGADPADTADKAKVAAYQQQARIATKARIAEIKNSIAGLEMLQGIRGNDVVSSRGTVKLSDSLKLLKAELRDLHSGKLATPKIAPPYRVGTIGKSTAVETEIVKIVGPEEMVVRLVYMVENAERRGPRDREESIIILRGFSTDALVEGTPLGVPSLMEAIGEEKIPGGQEKAMVFAPFELPDPPAKKRPEPAKKKPQA